MIDAGTAWLEAPDTHGEGTTPFWPDPERMARVDGAVRRTRASSSPPTRSATPRCASRSAPTCGPARPTAPATGSSTWRRSRTTSSRRSRAERRRPPRCSPCTWPRCAPTDGNWSERLGPERAARAFRMRDLLDAGAVLALGYDWPVADADPRPRAAPPRGVASSGRPRQALTAARGARGLHARARPRGGRGGRGRAHPRGDARRPHRPGASTRWTRPRRSCRRTRSGSRWSAGAWCSPTRTSGLKLGQPRLHTADQLRHPARLGLAQRLAQQRLGARAVAVAARASSNSAYSRRISATTGRSPQPR